MSSFAANEKWFVQKLDHFNNEVGTSLIGVNLVSNKQCFT